MHVRPKSPGPKLILNCLELAGPGLSDFLSHKKGAIFALRWGSRVWPMFPACFLGGGGGV